MIFNFFLKGFYLEYMMININIIGYGVENKKNRVFRLKGKYILFFFHFFFKDFL